MNTGFLILIILFDFCIGVTTLYTLENLPKAWKGPFFIAGLGLIVQSIQSFLYVLNIQEFNDMPFWALKDIGLGYILVAVIKAIKNGNDTFK